MMKTLIKPAIVAGIAIAALSSPAAAQVNGVATLRIPLAIATSQAIQNGFTAVSTQYAADITRLEQLGTQRQQLLQALDANQDGQLTEIDTNGDGQVDATEQAAQPSLAQAAQIEQQMNQIQQPILLAQAFVVSQVAEQANGAVQDVITQRGIQVLLSPEAIIYGNEAVDVTQLVQTALNTRAPSVSTTPTPGWQPDEGVAGLYQQIQQIRQALAARAQQQAAGQTTGAVTER